MSRNIMDFFPYPKPRDVQVAILRKIEQLWNSYDVFCVVAPTALGKSAVSRTLQRWQYSASMITPTNMLVDQFLQEFPDAPTLHRLDSYRCEEWQTSCSAHRGHARAFCKGCPAAASLATAKYRRGPGVYNYYTYLAHKLHRDTLIVDEAHNLVPTIQDRLAETIWMHDYPELNVGDNATLLRRIGQLPKRKQQHKKVTHLYEALTSPVPHHVLQRTTEPFSGKGTKRGEPEDRACIKLYPVDIGDAFGMFTGAGDVKKIVLMSATIGPVDVAELGLQRKRVCYLQAAHPIPAERRAVHLIPVADINHGNLLASVPALAEEIENIAQYHAGEKGIIHATYGLASMLAEHLGDDPRFIFHTRENKQEQYQRFRDSPSEEGAVLVASGMYEGIDLPDDLGRWQVIAKVPWKSLGDPAIKYKAEQDPDWYRWATLKDLIQACGRICRHEEDYGVTYILDGSAQRLISSASHLIPSWFSDALVT